MRFTSNHMEILRVLSEESRSYSSEIARLTGQNHRNVSVRLRALATEGYIEEANPPKKWAKDNPRQTGIVRFFRLSKKGKEVLKDEAQTNSN